MFQEHTGQQLDGSLMPLTFHSVLDKHTESISLWLNVNDPILDASVRITNLKCCRVHKENGEICFTSSANEINTSHLTYSCNLLTFCKVWRWRDCQTGGLFKPMQRNADSNMIESEWTSFKDSLYTKSMSTCLLEA